MLPQNIFYNFEMQILQIIIYFSQRYMSYPNEILNYAVEKIYNFID